MRIWTTSMGTLFLFFCLGISSASANTTNLSFDLSFGAQPFSYFCQPYKYSFETGKHYVAGPGAYCVYTIPNSISGSKMIAVYKGTPGNSTFVTNDQVIGGSPTVVEELSTNFGSPNQDQDYFSVVYGLNTSEENTLFDIAFRTGSSTNTLPPNNNYRVIQWKWGSKPGSEYDPVIIIPGILGSWEKNGDWIVDPILHTYDNLIDTFLANGYVEGKTLFRFGYDWEEPNEVTAHVLANKIQAIKQTCGCSHVDLIGHSMGGLVASQYIESGDYKNDVDQLFLVATPLSGAPKAYKAWEGGVTDFGNDIQNAFMQTKFWFEARGNGYTSVFDYIRKKPIESIHELLPTYDYLFDPGPVQRFYPTNYPVNGFLDTLLSSFTQKVTNNVRSNIILADTLTDTTISGFLVATSTQSPKWEYGEPTQTFFDNGDGTVPRISIENLVGYADKEIDAVNHTEIASTSAGYIFQQLNNKVPTVIVGNKPNPVFSYLYFKLFSPVDMQIIAPDGKRLGKNFSTNAEIGEIPGAFYSGFATDNEYAIILNPIPGQYKIETVGTGSGGEYTIAADYFGGTSTTEAILTSSTTPAQIIDHSLYLSSTTTAITLSKQVPPSPLPPPTSLTPDTCLVDMAKAYKDKWITKKLVYDGLVFDCKALKGLFKEQERINAILPSKRTGKDKLLLAATMAGIKLTLTGMDLLAKDKGNTKQGVELISKYTTWFKDHDPH